MKKRVTSQTHRKAVRKETTGLPLSTSTRRSFEQSPPDLLERLTTIPLLFDSRMPRGSVTAGVAEDSWATGERPGMRDVVDGHIRRIAFVAGSCRFELVAERRSNQWEFVGRVYHRGRTLNDMLLVLGRRRLLPGVGGFFHWSSKHVVRRLSLVGPEKHITLESIAW